MHHHAHPFHRFLQSLLGAVDIPAPVFHFPHFVYVDPCQFLLGTLTQILEHPSSLNQNKPIDPHTSVSPPPSPARPGPFSQSLRTPSLPTAHPPQPTRASQL